MRPCVRSYALALFAFALCVSSVNVPQVSAQQPPIAAGQVIISELRLRGPNGAEDEFVEIYNNTDSPIVVAATDQSAGWTVAISNGQITGPLFTIPNGTTIPARGHLLGANTNGYSLSGYPSGNPNVSVTAKAPEGDTSAIIISPFGLTTPDRTWDFDVPDGTGVALFSTTNGTNLTAATRLDAFGFTGSPALYREGGGFPTVVTVGLEHTYYRDLRAVTPRDTNDNAADFLLVSTQTNLQIPRLGAPGPENLSSPIVNHTTIGASLLDQNVGAASPPNRERSPTVEPNADLGTLLLRRTFTNNTGQPVTRLRFRVINLTTLGTPASECIGGPCADVRALTSQDGTATTSNQTVVVVRGVRLEEPPAQPNGGAYNSSLSADFITLGQPLPDGISVNIEFKLGVMTSGLFRFLLNIEALTGTAPPVILATDPPTVGFDGPTDSRKKRWLWERDPTPPDFPSAPTTAPAPAPAAPAPSAATPRRALIPWLVAPKAPLTLKTPRASDAEEDDDDKEKESKDAAEAPAEQSTAGQPEATAPTEAKSAAPSDAGKKAPAPAKAPKRRDQ